MMKKSLLVFALLFVSVLALELPPGLEAGAQATLSRAQKISVILAFMGGVLTILSPCFLPIIPAFFAYTFKEKKNIAKMSLVFFLGFTSIFIIFGLFASFAGQVLTMYKTQLILVSGITFVVLGIMELMGKGFSLPQINVQTGTDTIGVFTFGALFAIGWTPCIGPILGGILLIAVTFGNYLTSTIMLVSYSLGIFLPLLIVSLLYDKFDLSKHPLVRGKMLKIGGYEVHSSRLVVGGILLFFGLSFLILGGTSFINRIDLFNTKGLFYSIQDLLLPPIK
jgi:cytochrome c biogenesis protein CcdA